VVRCRDCGNCNGDICTIEGRTVDHSNDSQEHCAMFQPRNTCEGYERDDTEGPRAGWEQEYQSQPETQQPRNIPETMVRCEDESCENCGNRNGYTCGIDGGDTRTVDPNLPCTAWNPIPNTCANCSILRELRNSCITYRRTIVWVQYHDVPACEHHERVPEPQAKPLDEVLFSKDYLEFFHNPLGKCGSCKYFRFCIKISDSTNLKYIELHCLKDNIIGGARNIHIPNRCYEASEDYQNWVCAQIRVPIENAKKFGEIVL